jgi:hypothetical protein
MIAELTHSVHPVNRAHAFITGTNKKISLTKPWKVLMVFKLVVIDSHDGAPQVSRHII